MENNFEMFKRPSLINSIKSWSYTKKMIVLLSIFFVLLNVLPIIFSGIPLVFGGDDASQYHVFTRNVIHSIKDGTFSLYNPNQFFINSIFELEYYVPIDIFTLITFLLDYIMPFDYAYGATTALKIVSGVAMAYILFKKLGFKDKTSFLLSWIYTVTASAAYLYTFPCYVSTFFYIPLTIYILYIEKNQNIKWKTMVISFLLMLFNFYSGYMTVAIAMTFMLFVSVLQTKTINKKFWKDEIISLLKYIPFILIGVATSAMILVPSVMYILKNSTSERNVTFIYSFKHLFILTLNTISPTSSYSKMLRSDYITFQTGLYFTIFGLFSVISLLLTSNEKDKKKYIGILIAELIMVIIPFFSWIYSVSLAGYSRHFALFSLINLYLVGINYEKEGDNLEIYNHKKIIGVIATASIILLIIFVIWNYYTWFEKANLISTSIEALFFIMIWGLYFYSSYKDIKFKKLIFKLELALAFFITFSPLIRIDTSALNISNKTERNINYMVEKYNISKEEKIFYGCYWNSNAVCTNATLSEIWFSSFYPVEIDKYLDTYYKETNSTVKWTKDSQSIKDLMMLSFEGYKYFVIEDEYKDAYITSILKLLGEEDGYSVYENPYYKGSYIYYNQIEKSDNTSENGFNIGKGVILNEEILNKISSKNINYKTITLPLNNLVYQGLDDYNHVNDFYTDELSEFKDKKMIYLLSRCASEYTKIIYEDGSVEKTFYGSFVTDKKIKGFRLIGLCEDNIQITVVPYEQYLTLLDSYKSEGSASYKYIKNGLHVDVSKVNDKAVVVLPFTYSDELYCEEGYRLVEANGGLIGVVLDEGVTTASLNIKIKPVGLDTGIKISMILTPIFIMICSAGIYLENKKFVQKGIIWYN